VPLEPPTLTEAETQQLRAAALMFSASGDLITANEAAEALLGHTLALLARKKLAQGSADTPLSALIERARLADACVRERRLEINLPGHAPLEVEAAASPLSHGAVLVTLTAKPSAGGFDRGTDLRSVAGMGRTLAHEIKNPLAGIRGAAQLLKTGAAPADQPLAQLIVDETDRIRRLVDRMEAFSEEAPTPRSAVNIHQVLDRVRALVANGVADGSDFARAVRSVPAVRLGDEDQLIQIFLNLMPRTPPRPPMPAATTRRYPFHRLSTRAFACAALMAAPARVRPRGPDPGQWSRGARSLRDHLFQPFVTTKANGTGLGLALVAKLVAAHGGLIDFESEPGRTVFRVLPADGARYPFRRRVSMNAANKKILIADDDVHPAGAQPGLHPSWAIRSARPATPPPC
jgi:two-component system, NtrC family, nitrogen regulation sensor histidine kinase GlnL